MSDLIKRLRESYNNWDSGYKADGALLGEAADALEGADARIADLEAQLVKANDAWLSLSQASAPECQACGDGITAHDPGVCGNCFAMKYRDRTTET